MKFNNLIKANDSLEFRRKMNLYVFNNDIISAIQEATKFYEKFDFPFRNIAPIEDMAVMENIDYLIHESSLKERDVYNKFVKVREGIISMILSTIDNFIPRPSLKELIDECRRNIKYFDIFYLNNFNNEPINIQMGDKDIPNKFRNMNDKEVNIFTICIYYEKPFINISTYSSVPFFTPFI